MNKHYVKSFIYFLFILMGLFSTQINSNSNNENITVKELQDHKDWIQKLKKELTSKQQEEDQQTKALRLIETKIASLENSLNQMEKTLSETETKLHELEKQKLSLLESLEKKRTYLKQQIKACHLFKQNNRIKIFLSQKNIYATDRLLHYYHVLEQHHYHLLHALLDELNKVRSSQNDIDQTQLRIKNFQEEEKQLLKEVLAQKSHRQSMLAALEKDILNKKLSLLEAEQHEKLLSNKLSQVQKALEDKRSLFFKPTLFTKAQGNLLWPIPKQNRIVQAIPSLIKTEEGTEVQATFRGQVVFADWLKGFGLLIIIDHGEGFLSLYGHNQMLYKNLGDRVFQGERIARVGNSGGLDNSGLYFDIRKNGKSVNLANWFK